MKSLNSLSNQVGGLSTQAVETLTHRLRSNCSGVREGNASSVPSESLIRYPSTFSARGGNPDSGLSLVMDDGQSPLRLKIDYFAIGDQLGSKRIHDFDHFVSKYELRFDPDGVGHSTEHGCNQQFSDGLQANSNYKDAIGDEEGEQHQGNTSPREVASGPEGLLHMPSIAGGRR